MLSSGVWAGAFTLPYGHSRPSSIPTSSTTTLKSELSRIGFLGSEPCTYTSNPLLAHFETHIEQGPILDRAQEAVAIVRGVQSMRWYSISVVGAEAHTGTTPMDARRDALLGAALMIVEANKISTTAESWEKQTRMTIAVVNSAPQSINTIAGHVTMNLDIRSPRDEDVEAVEIVCRGRFDEIARAQGLEVKMETIWESKAVQFDEVMVDCIRRSAREIGCERELVSGAGHDRYVLVRFGVRWR
jgi:acetylornithine deacetylase/succinyl-diaminopimelate desuccinylase-like protein